MKKIAISVLLFLGGITFGPSFIEPVLSISLVETVDAAVSVKGYYRKDGTYVRPHMRSNPDGNPYNNWSYPGNTNPYTGETATGNESTYLKNYNGGSSSYTPSISLPSYTPSYSLPAVKTSTSHKLNPKKELSNASSSIECGENAYYSMTSGCRCKIGYSGSSGTNCKFSGCPVGQILNSYSECEVSKVSKQVACLTKKKPCTCPSGYIPSGNRICVSN